MLADQGPMSLEEAQRLFDRPAQVRAAGAVPGGGGVQSANEAQKARSKAVYDTALSVGLRAGLTWQLRNINAAVQGMSRDLDLVYDFGALMINQRVVPPVITEARNLYNQDGDYAVRLSGAFYKIERQARISSVPPNWREYLSFPKGVLPDQSDMLAIRSDDDRLVWREAVKNGWAQGVEQANLMLKQAMDRLNRDFGGMSRFHKFVVEGKVSLPAIASEDIPVSKNGSTMAVDETLLRITTLPDFNSKMGSWQAIVTSSARPAQGKGSTK
jgi:defect-in-organelle-trafficking protein DotC